MRKRIFRSMTALALFAVLLTAALMTGVLCLEFYTDLKENISNEAAYLATGLDLVGDRYLEQLQSTNRITIFAPDRSVVYDNAYDPALLGGVTREEVERAFAGGRGDKLRYVNGQYTYYSARRLADGRVVRVADQIVGVFATLLATLPVVLGVAALAVVASLVLARRATAKIVAPINRLNLDDPVPGSAYEEISPLLERIVQQKEELEQQIDQLLEYQRQLAAITQQMSEGLMMLGPRGEILSLNQSASQMLGFSLDACRGKTVAQMGGAETTRQAVAQALGGESGEGLVWLGERLLRVTANPVWEGEERTGVVLLLVDVTKQEAAEKLRREFSANVSHELKTPLTSISGYAEILRDGLVKPQDVSRFAGRIHQEAATMTRMIQDILRLSRLEEAQPAPPWEPVDLLALARQVAARLAEQAARQEIALGVEGSPAVIWGEPGVLEEMVYNLAENAIKYGRPGGWVKVEVAPRPGGGATLQVQDNGIGIAPQERERIFERFYQVDKSRSRAGGSGLGLSIVKHAALHHGATITLDGALGEGTTVTVAFGSGDKFGEER